MNWQGAPPVIHSVEAPPCSNVEAECALLGALMISNGLIDKVADIVAVEDFAEPVCGRVFACILMLRGMGRDANPVTLKPYFDEDAALTDLGGVGFLAQLTGSGAAVIGAVDFARQIADLAKRRRLRETYFHCARLCEDFEQDLDAIASLSEGAVSEALATDGGGESISAAGAVEANLNAQFDGVQGVMCGIIPSVDHALGAACPGDLIIVAGRPGMGKTALGICYARGVASQGHGVAIISLEMRASQLGGRMAADLLHDTGDAVPYKAISENRCDQEQRRSMARAALQLREWPIWIEDLPSASVSRLGAIVRKHKRRLAARGKVLALVVVDYLQLLSPDRPGKNIYEDTSRVSKGLKSLARAEGVAIMAICQLNRAVDDRKGWRPRLSDLRDSGQLEQDADSIMFVVRPEEYLKREEPDPNDPAEWADWRAEIEPHRGKLELFVAKRRAGEVTIAHALWDGQHQAVRG